MKRIYIKTAMALVLAGTVALTGCSNGEIIETVAQPQQTEAEAIAEHSDNDRTVYIMTDSLGTTEKVMATDALINAFSEQKEDNTAFVMTDIDGKEIAYGGSYDEAVPVGVNVVYTLDGVQTAPDQLAGKSGHLKMKIKYTNSAYEVKAIQGKSQRIYVPFVMASGFLLDNDIFTNITAQNARLMDSDGETIVAGIAVPGFMESLNMDSEENNLDFIEVEADVKNFKLDNIYTVAMPVSLDDIKTGKIKTKLNDLYSAMDDLNNAMNKLTDGSNKLYDGSVTLKNGTKELYDGLDTLAKNNDSLNGGAKTVFETLLSTVTTQIKASGLDIPSLTIDNYQSVLKATIASLDRDAVYATAEKEVRAVIEAQYKDQIVSAVTDAVRSNVRMQVEATVTDQYTQAITETVTAEVNKNIPAITQAVTSEVTAQVTANVKSAVLTQNNLTEESYSALDQDTKATIDTAIQQASAQQMETAAVKELIAQKTEEQRQALISQNVARQLAAKQPEMDALIERNTDLQMRTEEIKAIIDENVTAQINSQVENYIATNPEIQSKFAQARQGLVQLQGALAQLDSYNEFYVGLKTYTRGVRTAKNGAKKLYDGVKELSNGAKELRDGIKKLNDEGIQKLINTVNSDIKATQENFDAVKAVSNTYAPFEDTTNQRIESVKYIFTTRPIK